MNIASDEIISALCERLASNQKILAMWLEGEDETIHKGIANGTPRTGTISP